MKQILLSVIIPSYNRVSLLKNTLDALDKQILDKKFWEIIIIADGSIPEMINFLKSKPNLKYVGIDKKGPATARNVGAKIASGEMLVFSDDDAIPSETWLYNIHNAYFRGIVKEAVEGDVVRIGNNRPLAKSVNKIGPNGCLTCNFGIRKDIFEKLGGFNIDFEDPINEDLEFFHRLKQSHKVTYLPNIVVHHPVYDEDINSALFDFSAFTHRRVKAEYLFQKLTKDSYSSMKYRNNATETLRDWSLKYFYLEFKKVSFKEIISRPFTTLIWLIVIVFRQLSFLRIMLAGVKE